MSKRKYSLKRLLFENQDDGYSEMPETSGIDEPDAGDGKSYGTFGAANAGRVGGLVGEQLFKRVLNFSAVEGSVVIETGDSSTDMSVRVYDEVKLGGGALDPRHSPQNGSDQEHDKYTYQVREDSGTNYSCEVGFEDKYIYVGQFIISNRRPGYRPNSNLEADFTQTVQNNNGGQLDFPDPEHWVWRPRDRTWNRHSPFLTSIFGHKYDNDPNKIRAAYAADKYWDPSDAEQMWLAGGDDYFLYLSRGRSGAPGGRIVRRGDDEFGSLIMGHKESLEVDSTYVPRKYGFEWRDLDPDANISNTEQETLDRESNFIQKSIPLLSSICNNVPKLLRYDSKNGGTLKVVSEWEHWDWSQAPQIEITSEADNIMTINQS